MSRSIFHFLLFLTSILFGRWVGFSIFYASREVDLYPSTQMAVMRLKADSLNTSQTSFILISVDQLASGKSHLQTAWWVAYNPQTPLVFVSIYPGGTDSSTKDEELARSFQIRSRNGSRQVDPAFLRVLNNRQIPWDGYLILDNEAIVRIIDFLGDVELAGHLLNSTEVLESLQSTPGDPSSILTFQANLWQGLCWNAFHYNARFDTQVLMEGISEHILISLNFPSTISDWPSLVARSRYPSCEIHPTHIQAASLR